MEIKWKIFGVIQNTYRALIDGERACMRALAKQMDASERMIQQRYKHDVIFDYEDELLGKKEVISDQK